MIMKYGTKRHSLDRMKAGMIARASASQLMGAMFRCSRPTFSSPYGWRKERVGKQEGVVPQADELRLGQQIVVRQAQPEGLEHRGKLEHHQQQEHRREEEISPELMAGGAGPHRSRRSS